LYSQNFPSGNILASIGSHKISYAQFEERYKSFLFNTGIRDNYAVRQATLNNMINEILLKHYDNNEQILNNPEYKRELEWSKQEVILAYLKDQEIHAKLTASEEEMREAFIRVNEKVAARHLFAQTEEEAEYLYELLMMGVDFENLAAQVFTDSVLRNNGGYLGYFTWGDMDPAFEDVAFSLNVGEISKPVKTEFGYSIIKVEDHQRHPLITEFQYQQKKGQLERVIKVSKKKSAEVKYLNSILDKEKINFNEESLNTLLKKYTGLTQDNELNNVDNQTVITAEYEKNKYSQKQVEQWLTSMPAYHKAKIISVENLKTIITGFLIKERLLQIATEKQYEKYPEVAEMIEDKKDNLFFKYKRAKITSEAEISDDAARKFYNQNSHLFYKEDEINVQEIIVEDERLADSLFNLLTKGKDFSGLARKFSTREWSAKNGGEMGYAPVSQYGMMKDRLQKMNVGEIIGPLNIENYYGILKMLGKTEGSLVEFSIIKNEVKKLLKNEKEKEILENYLNGLKSKTSIKLNNELLLNSKITG
jgi:parvulin-like peptidyl-prolyl isomerase